MEFMELELGKFMKWIPRKPAALPVASQVLQRGLRPGSDCSTVSQPEGGLVKASQTVLQYLRGFRQCCRLPGRLYPRIFGSQIINSINSMNSINSINSAEQTNAAAGSFLPEAPKAAV